MISLVDLGKEIVRILTHATQGQIASRYSNKHRIWKVKSASGGLDPWELRILELADGKTVDEVANVLYTEQLQAGAWIVDIALWKSVFDQRVSLTIEELVSRGLLCRGPPESSLTQ